MGTSDPVLGGFPGQRVKGVVVVLSATTMVHKRFPVVQVRFPDKLYEFLCKRE